MIGDVIFRGRRDGREAVAFIGSGFDTLAQVNEFAQRVRGALHRPEFWVHFVVDRDLPAWCRGAKYFGVCHSFGTDNAWIWQWSMRFPGRTGGELTGTIAECRGSHLIEQFWSEWLARRPSMR